MRILEKDKKIILELDKDSRQSHSQIARKTSLSKQVVSYRIAKMIKEKVILNFNTVINANLVGAIYYNVFFRRKSFDKNRELEFINYVKAAEHISWTVNCTGNYDYLAAFMAKNLLQFNEQMNEMLSKFADYLSEYDILQILEGSKLRYKYLGGKEELLDRHYPSKIKDTIEELEYDSTDLQILDILDKDSRTSSTDIAKEINCTSNIVAYRIKRMKKEGIIQGFRVLLDPQKLGREWHIILFEINPIDPKRMNELLSYLTNHLNAVFYTRGLGAWHLLVDFHVEKATEIDCILQDVRNNFSDLIKKYAPLRVTDVYKTEFFPRCLMK